MHALFHSLLVGELERDVQGMIEMTGYLQADELRGLQGEAEG
jgi:hypothetical protein